MRLFIIIGCLFLSKICTAQIKDAHAYNGNKLYANGKYKEATAIALVMLIVSFIILLLINIIQSRVNRIAGNK